MLDGEYVLQNDYGDKIILEMTWLLKRIRRRKLSTHKPKIGGCLMNTWVENIHWSILRIMIQGEVIKSLQAFASGVKRLDASCIIELHSPVPHSA